MMKVNVLTITLGLLVGLVASVLAGVAMAAAKVVSIGQDALTIKKAPRKTSTTGAGVGSAGASVKEMPQGKRDAEIYPAA
jgi:hypothetical protein